MVSRAGGDARAHHCEICDGEVAQRDLRGGGWLGACSACGHLHRNLADAPAGHRDAAYGGDPALDVVRTRLTYGWLRSDRTPRSVFEIGYGSGGLLRRFLDDGAEVSGVDPDQLAIDVDPVVAERANLWDCAIEDVPEGVVEADLVVGVHVIEHVTDPGLTLRKAASMLSPSGELVLITPAGDSWGPGAFGAAWWMLEDPTHVRFFTEESLRRLAVDAGLVDVRVDRLILDSISVDVASMARLRGSTGPAGVLARRGVRNAVLATAPFVVGLRAAVPRTRPTLRLTARRGPR